MSRYKFFIEVCAQLLKLGNLAYAKQHNRGCNCNKPTIPRPFDFLGEVSNLDESVYFRYRSSGHKMASNRRASSKANAEKSVCFASFSKSKRCSNIAGTVTMLLSAASIYSLVYCGLSQKLNLRSDLRVLELSLLSLLLSLPPVVLIAAGVTLLESLWIHHLNHRDAHSKTNRQSSE
jgi:hypothetical protein